MPNTAILSLSMSRESTLATAETSSPPPVVEQGGASEPSVRERARHEARRIRHGLRRPHNWFQLVRFSVVGASGYVINLAVYTTLVVGLDVQYVVAAVLAFCVAVTNNFLLNRSWTFKATGGRVKFQAPRFLTVSLLALGFNLLVLELLVGVAGVHKVAGQAAAILAATPVNFIGNKLWSFRLGHRTARPPASA
jgi:dolichol-phosphate mannosyltransferase